MAEAQFIGGFNAPGRRWGRFNAIWPLAVLTVADGVVKIKARPAFTLPPELARITLSATDIAVAYPLKGRVLAPGVGLELVDGRVFYFWTWRHGRDVLQALGRQGVKIDSERRRARAAWRWRATDA